MSYSADDRRRFRRVPAHNDVMVRRLEDQERKFAKSTVMGMGGLMFLSEEPYGVGTFLDLFVVIGGSVHQIHGRVANERPVNLEAFEVGVEFLQLGLHATQALHWMMDAPMVEH